jgi:hypothetical protein
VRTKDTRHPQGDDLPGAPSTADNDGEALNARLEGDPNERAEDDNRGVHEHLLPQKVPHHPPVVKAVIPRDARLLRSRAPRALPPRVSKG